MSETEVFIYDGEDIDVPSLDTKEHDEYIEDDWDGVEEYYDDEW